MLVLLAIGTTASAQEAGPCAQAVEAAEVGEAEATARQLAVCLADPVLSDDRRAAVLAELSNAFRERGELLAALRAADQAVALWPTAWRAHLQRGYALEALDRYGEAAEAAETALAVALEDVPGGQYLLGLNQARSGRLEEAAVALEAASDDQRFPSPVALRSHVLLALGRHDEALAAAWAALEREPDQLDVAIHLERLLVDEGRTEEAQEVLGDLVVYGKLQDRSVARIYLAVLDHALAGGGSLDVLELPLSLRRGSADYLNSVCWAAVMADVAEDALKVCRKAVRLAPTSGVVLHSLAVALEETGTEPEVVATLLARSFDLAPDCFVCALDAFRTAGSLP